MFLNIKLQRLWKYNLQCISSSKDSEELDKSLCVRDNAEDLCWMPVVFRPSDNTASLISTILSLTLLNGPRKNTETTVGKHNPPCHLQMPTKALSCKKKAICEHGPEAALCPVGQGSFKMDWFKVEKFTMVRQVQIWHSCGGENFQRVISVQFKSQHLWWYGEHKCMRYGQLAWFGRHYECWKVYKGFRATYAHLQMTSISGRPCVFQQDNAKPHTAAITTAWLRSRRVRVLNLPACSPDLSPIENIWRIIKQKNKSTMTTNSSAAGNLYHAWMGPHSNTKNS